MRYVALAAVVVILDQATKKWAKTYIKPGNTIEIVKNKVALTHVQNKGAAYGLFAKNPRVLWTASALAVAHLLFEMVVVIKNGRASIVDKIGWALTVGGAVGNLLDRARFKQVTDFIHIKFSPKAPVFNISDVSVMLGLIVLLLRQFAFKKNAD